MISLLLGSSYDGILVLKNRQVCRQLDSELCPVGTPCLYINSDPSTIYRLFRVLPTASVVLAVCFSNDLENTLTIFGNIKNFL